MKLTSLKDKTTGKAIFDTIAWIGVVAYVIAFILFVMGYGA